MNSDADLDRRVYSSLKRLLSLRDFVLSDKLRPPKSVQSLFSGQHGSRQRGRGLNFEELGHYRVGDDIRMMDWKATKRTGRPHVRVFTEDKERPVLFVVDQRMSMFFGSKHACKSVQAAELTAIFSWQLLAEGGAIGAVIFSDDSLVEHKPQRGQGKLVELLRLLSRVNQQLPVDVCPEVSSRQSLFRALQTADRLCAYDHLIVIVSDFLGFDEKTEKLLASLNLHNDVRLLAVTDPLERDLQGQASFVASDGEQQLSLDSSNTALVKAYAKSYCDALLQLQRCAQRYGPTLLQFDTGTDVATQLSEYRGQHVG